MTKPLFSRMTVIGVGLMGGSLSLASKKRGLVGEVIGFEPCAAQLMIAERLGVIDRSEPELPKSVEGSDLVVLAAPVGVFESALKEIGPCAPPGCVITDIGSVKGDLVLRLERLTPPGVFFVGAHPIAGKEKSGVEEASSELFSGARCILTPTPKTDLRALERLREFWEALGSNVLEMEPDLHDRMLAAVSHLPHLLAYALMEALSCAPLAAEGLLGLSGGGLRDFTRIAASSPEMWRDIALLNAREILSALTAYETVLKQVHRMIADQDGAGLLSLFERAKAARERLADSFPAKTS